MKSKKANLVIAIGKNIVEQYCEELEQSIADGIEKYELVDDYLYENLVARAEIARIEVRRILDNFDKSVFDGVINENGVYRAVYTSNGRELKEVLYKEKMSIDDYEYGLALEGVARIFEQIGIPKYAIYPIIADAMERFRDKNYVGGNINTSLVKINNKMFNENGKYVVGDLVINNLLSSKVTSDTGVLVYTNDKPVIYNQGRELILDSNPIGNIINEYIKGEINDNNLVMLDEQNTLVSDTFESLKPIGNIIMSSNSDVLYSEYYYDYFKSVFKYGYKGGKDFFTVPRTVLKNNKLESIDFLENKKNDNSLFIKRNILDFNDYDISSLQNIIDDINNMYNNRDKLENEYDFSELDIYKNNIMLSLFKTLLGDKYNDGFGVYMVEHWLFVRMFDNLSGNLRVENNDNSIIVYADNEKIFEHKIVKFNDHNINKNTISEDYSIFDTLYYNGVSYSFFDNKMTFDGNEMLFNENGLCVEGYFVESQNNELHSKRIVRDESDLSLVHVDYFVDSNKTMSDDKYLANLSKINTEAQYNEKRDYDDYMRVLRRVLDGYEEFNDYISYVSDAYLQQNSRSL